MKLFFKIFAFVAAVFTMLVVGFFLMPSASTYAKAYSQPVFMAAGWVQVEADVAQPLVHESDLLVTPAMLSHLKLYVGYKKTAYALRLTNTAGIDNKKGGFQKIGIVRLIKFRKSSNGENAEIGV
ncbi:hypothetical protein KAR91_55940 [Candidatus Pacearchaeota archaeon]|nr:hypothetical protein [Candidatus Pacearchaeota archaeon]